MKPSREVWNAMQRIAQCACGSVRLVAIGEPSSVVACHCLACQRRTGSVFGVGAYFPSEQVTVTGATREYVRPTEAGNQFFTYFCPTCGTSTHWQTSKNPGLLGVAVGAFADASFPQPIRSVWEQSMHTWVEIPAAEQHFAKGRVA
jgi:hypothetical protein